MAISNIVKGIIFDYGGTIDSRGTHWSEIIWDGYKVAGIPVDKETFREAYVFAERELARNPIIVPTDNFHDLLLKKMRIEITWLAERDFIPCDLIEKWSQEVALYCYNAAKECTTEARHVIDTLSKRYPLVLVSNFYGNIESVLADFDLLRYFPTIIESAVVGVRKPDPQIFRLGVEAMGIPAEQVLVVGDSYKKDIVPAETIGCQVAWLKGKGWTADEDAVTHPNIIKSLEDLL
jgi:putative hydrolase of the HAD superfamily